MANAYRRRWLETAADHDALVQKTRTLQQQPHDWYRDLLILVGGIGVGIIAHELAN